MDICVAQPPNVVQPTIYVYRGTFDPFHKNHEAICRWFISQSNTIKLVVHINYRPSNRESLKQPASWDDRFEIVKCVLNDDAEIRPKESFDTTLNWIVDTYGSAVDIVQVFGSDVLEQMVDKPQITSYAQHIRCDEIKRSAHLNHKPLVTIPLDLPPISSTAIRKLLLNGDFHAITAKLSKKAIEKIKMIKDYSMLSLSIKNLQNNQLLISDNLAHKLARNFGVNTYLEDKTQQFKGRSGDTIFSVIHNNQSIAIGKLFRLGAEACRKEVTNHRLITRFIKTPLIYFTGDNLVCMQHIKGKSPQSVSDYNSIGKAYRTLHQKSLSNCKKVCEPFEADNIKNDVVALCTKLSNTVVAEKITFIFDLLLNAYLEQPHKSVVIHGDAQPGNVLIKADKVILIDFGKVKQGEDPARDVNQMISSIYWKAWHDKMTTAEDVLILKESVNAFLGGYSYRITTAADKFWNLYWNVRCFLLTLETPDLALAIHIRTEINSIVEYYFPTSYTPGFFGSRSAQPLTSEKIELKQDISAACTLGHY